MALRRQPVRYRQTHSFLYFSFLLLHVGNLDHPYAVSKTRRAYRSPLTISS